MGGLATGLAIASLTITAGTTANSFVQAGKERRKADQYEQDADEALAEARAEPLYSAALCYTLFVSIYT